MSTESVNIAEGDRNPIYASWYAGKVREDGGNRRRLSLCPRGEEVFEAGPLTLSLTETKNLLTYLGYHPDSEPFRQSLPPAQLRGSLLLRIARLWAGDWSGGTFDGKDGSRWIHLALGTDEQMAELDVLLTDIESMY